MNVKTNWGWGVCQIDKGPFNNSATQWVSTAEVYNWKTNCLAGAKVLDNKLKEHREGMQKIKTFYGNKWTDPSGMVYTNANGVKMDVEQYCVTVRYNGCGGCKPTRLGFKIVNGEVKYDVVQSPLQFDPARTPKWKFVDNENNYADKISKRFMNPGIISE